MAEAVSSNVCLSSMVKLYCQTRGPKINSFLNAGSSCPGNTERPTLEKLLEVAWPIAISKSVGVASDNVNRQSFCLASTGALVQDCRLKDSRIKAACIPRSMEFEAISKTPCGENVRLLRSGFPLFSGRIRRIRPSKRSSPDHENLPFSSTSIIEMTSSLHRPLPLHHRLAPHPLHRRCRR